MAKIQKWMPDGTNTAYPVTCSKAVVYVEESSATTTVLIDDKLKEVDVLEKTATGSGAVRKNLNGTTALGTATGANATSFGGDASGNLAFSEGVDTEASGNGSHAEGNETTASGGASHAEGKGTTASGIDSHAEGLDSTASGDYSHAEGQECTASGDYSHAEGGATLAKNEGEHAEGNFNVSHSGSTDNSKNTLSSVGIGTSSTARKNAVEVMQNGDLYILGIGGYDGTNAGTANIRSVGSCVESSIDCSSVFGTTPALPKKADGSTAYTLAELQGENLYALIDSNRYPVTLKYDSTATSGSQGLFYYVDFDGTTTQIVKSLL